MAGDSLALGQDRHRGVVAEEPLAGQDMRFDERMQRGKRRRASAHLIRQRRHAQIDALAGKSLCRLSG